MYSLVSKFLLVLVFFYLSAGTTHANLYSDLERDVEAARAARKEKQCGEIKKPLCLGDLVLTATKNSSGCITSYTCAKEIKKSVIIDNSKKIDTPPKSDTPKKCKDGDEKYYFDGDKISECNIRSRKYFCEVTYAPTNLHVCKDGVWVKDTAQTNTQTTKTSKSTCSVLNREYRNGSPAPVGWCCPGKRCNPCGGAKCVNGTWKANSTNTTTPNTPNTTNRTCTSQGKQYKEGEQINSCILMGESACQRSGEMPILTCRNGQWKGFE